MGHEAAAVWYVIGGALLLTIAFVGASIRHLPFSTALVYLCAGFLLASPAIGLLDVQLPRDAWWIERATELALVVSLFSTGLHLRAPWRDPRWGWVLRLGAGVTMLTALAVAGAGVWLLGLSWGAAILLGGLLAPTDPLLARDVQLEHPYDRSPLRFALTGEAGLNDGAAFPFVLLGLGLLHAPAGATGSHWLLRDVLWATSAGLLVGWGLGTLLGRLVLHLRRRYRQAVGLDHFLALGLMASSYGLALAAHGYGFLAVFAAGLALRRVELAESGERPPEELTQVAAIPSARADVATDDRTAPVWLAQTSMRFTSLVEQLGEMFVMTLVGAMLPGRVWSLRSVLFLVVLFVVIRPAAVWVALTGTRSTRVDRALVGWFGIRGVASLYYAAFALTHDAPLDIMTGVMHVALAAIAVSTIAHGITVTPLMRLHAVPPDTHRRSAAASGPRRPERASQSGS